MIDNLKRLNDLDIVLAKMDEDALNQLYLQVFQTPGGELVLQDLANRCFVFEVGNNPLDEGMRAVWLSIQSRLRAVVAIKKEVASNV